MRLSHRFRPPCLSPFLATFDQRRDGRVVAGIQRRLLRREEAEQRRVRRADDCRTARCIMRSFDCE